MSQKNPITPAEALQRVIEHREIFHDEMLHLMRLIMSGDMSPMLTHGARSVLSHAKEPGPWLEQIKARRPANVVIVAQAAKMARTIWAVTAKEQSCQRGFKSVRPQAA